MLMESKNSDFIIYREAALKIRNAILQSRYRTAANANADMLNLYYGVGEYISANTRSGKWGMGAIDEISKQLQGEIPGLHGFSPTNMKNMRIFYEQWATELEPNRQLQSADFNKADRNDTALSIRQTLSAELEENKFTAFYCVGFSHHREILRKCKTSDERWYYILRCANEFWSYRTLKDHLACRRFFIIRQYAQ
jgi:hypothetical protein